MDVAGPGAGAVASVILFIAIMAAIIVNIHDRMRALHAWPINAAPSLRVVPASEVASRPATAPRRPGQTEVNWVSFFQPCRMILTFNRIKLVAFLNKQMGPPPLHSPC